MHNRLIARHARGVVGTTQRAGMTTTSAATGWQISSLTFTIQWATGKMNIVTLAAAAGQS
jgi:hypothetical protein